MGRSWAWGYNLMYGAGATVSRSGRRPVPLGLSSAGRGRSFRACGGDGQTVTACGRRRSVPAWELGPLAILASCPAWAAPGVVFLPGVRAWAAADQLRRSGRRGRSAAGDPGRVRSWAASGGLRRQSWSRGRSGGSWRQRSGAGPVVTGRRYGAAGVRAAPGPDFPGPGRTLLPCEIFPDILPCAFSGPLPADQIFLGGTLLLFQNFSGGWDETPLRDFPVI